jgi:hypothetical protein
VVAGALEIEERELLFYRSMIDTASSRAGR